MTILLGSIADDYTGASDLANTLTKNGLRTVQTVGIPDPSLVLPDVDAVVVSLKIRSVAAEEAVAAASKAERWLRDRGAAHVLLCEQDAALVAQLLAAKTKLSAEAVRVERGNGLTALERVAAGSLDAVFLDPPFESVALYEPSLRAAARALRAGGSVYLEAPRRWSDEELAAFGLVGFRYLKAGAVHAHLLRPVAQPTA